MSRGNNNRQPATPVRVVQPVADWTLLCITGDEGDAAADIADIMAESNFAAWAKDVASAPYSGSVTDGRMLHNVGACDRLELLVLSQVAGIAIGLQAWGWDGISPADVSQAVYDNLVFPRYNTAGTTPPTNPGHGRDIALGLPRALSNDLGYTPVGLSVPLTSSDEKVNLSFGGTLGRTPYRVSTGTTWHLCPLVTFNCAGVSFAMPTLIVNAPEETMAVLGRFL